MGDQARAQGQAPATARPRLNQARPLATGRPTAVLHYRGSSRRRGTLPRAPAALHRRDRWRLVDMQSALALLPARRAAGLGEARPPLERTTDFFASWGLLPPNQKVGAWRTRLILSAVPETSPPVGGLCSVKHLATYTRAAWASKRKRLVPSMSWATGRGCTSGYVLVTNSRMRSPISSVARLSSPVTIERPPPSLATAV